MNYRQVTCEERYLISQLKVAGKPIREIASLLGRHRSTLYRELKRNKAQDGTYKVERAGEQARARRSRPRRHSYFEKPQWQRVFELLLEGWSPEQISLKLAERGELHIHWETIYRWIWADHRRGGLLFHLLRQSPKKRRKRYRSHDSRGVLPGKRPIQERPLGAQQRTEKGHFEIDLVHGYRSRGCVLTLVDRKTRLTHIERLKDKTVKEVNRHLIPLVRRYAIKTITSDNGCEFHGFKEVEERTGVRFYFATPHHSWERGTSENTNGLIRQYLPKTRSMRFVTQWECNGIARRLNRRPRKILNLKTPEESHYEVAA